MRALAACALLLLAACAGTDKAASFDPAALKPTLDDASDVTLVGRLQTGADMRLYPGPSMSGACIAIRPFSLAGVTPDSYNGKTMAVTGRIVADPAARCPSGLVIVASDISMP